MIIAINGSLGSGKSTVAKLIAKKLDFIYVSTGVWFRELALQKNISVIDLNLMAETDSRIDDYIDGKLKEYNEKEGDYVIDSRMAPFFIKTALKVRLTVNDKEGAERIFGDEGRGAVENYDDMEEALKKYKIRTKSERERYLKIYGFNVDDESCYDLVIDTTDKDAQEISDIITKRVQEEPMRPQE